MNDRPDDPRFGLDAFDAVDPPDQWDEIVQRASVPSIAPRDRRPWWPIAAAAAALIVIAGSILALRDDEAEAPAPATVPTLPEPSTVEDAAPAPTTDAPAPTVPPVTVAPVTTAPPPTTVPPTTLPTITLAPTTTTAVPVVTGASLWDTECVEVAGAGEIETADPAAFASFVGLGAQPVLEVVLSGFGNSDAAQVGARALPIPGGLLVAAYADGAGVESTVIAAIDDDGAIRWRRCLEVDALLNLAPLSDAPEVAWLEVETAAPPFGRSLLGIDLATGEFRDAPDSVTFRSPIGAGRWRILDTRSDTEPVDEQDRILVLDLLDGTVDEVPYPVEVLGQTEVTVGLSITGEDVPVLGVELDDPAAARVYVDGAWTGDPDVRARVLPATIVTPFEGGLEYVDGAGRTVWSDPDWRAGSGEVYRHFATDDVVVAMTCLSIDEDDRCVFVDELRSPEYEFIGYDAATGDVLWRRDSGGVVFLGEGSRGLVSHDFDDDGFTDGSRMIDLRTGEPLVAAEVYEWPGEYFGTECCGGDQFNRTDRFGGVIIQKSDDRFFLWYPPALSTPTATASLLG